MRPIELLAVLFHGALNMVSEAVAISSGPRLEIAVEKVELEERVRVTVLVCCSVRVILVVVAVSSEEVMVSSEEVASGIVVV